MAKIAIVTDSTADLPTELAERYGIHIVPNALVFGEQTFHDGVDITPQEFYRRLRVDRHLPTTSAASVGDFLRVYARLSREVEAIVSIHLPQELSAICNSALIASRMVKGVSIHVIDSRTACMGQGFVALEAARAASEGRSLGEILHRVEEVIPRVNLLAVLDTLEYLRRGGRVPAVASLVTSALQLKPIIYLKDGKTSVLEVPRTKAKALSRMAEIMEEQVGRRPVHVAIFHANTLAEAKRVRDEVASRFDCVELYITECTPVIGVHTGPGSLGLTFWAEDAR
ncbi:MAG: DegV family protein [Chloroflexota bacterium]|nr:DegV family protein [Chloroflexota bacterium]